jgi:hypothetical protein
VRAENQENTRGLFPDNVVNLGSIDLVEVKTDCFCCPVRRVFIVTGVQKAKKGRFFAKSWHRAHEKSACQEKQQR